MLMQCVFCKGKIQDYKLINLDVITNLDHKPFEMRITWSGGIYVGMAYTVALIECPHCDMVFFLRPGSKRLDGMNLAIPEESISSISQDSADIQKMTPREKDELYEKIKKELLEKYI
jgi:hypothetical protein